MVSIPLGLSDWESASEDVSRIKLHNMYIVKNPSSGDGVSRVSRPTLTALLTVGLGPIYTMWQQPNVLQGDSLVVSGSELWRLTATGVATKIGNLPGADIPTIAGAQLIGLPDIIFITRAGTLYLTDGISMSYVSVPGLQQASSVASINSYFLVSIAGTQKFYWIEPGETTIDPLNFASAERIPDPIVSVNINSDEVWFLGLSGPEVWSTTGDSTTPFQRVTNRVYKDGCHSSDTVVSAPVNGIPALFWVTDTKTVVMAQGSPVRVSTEAVEEDLKEVDDISCWSFRYNRHDFYLVSSSQFTWVYDMLEGLWTRWDTYLLPYWVAQSGVQSGSTVTCGDKTSNQLYVLEEGVSDNGLPVIREVAGYLPPTPRPMKAGEVLAYVNSGWSPSYDLEPFLELRWSDDRGATWSPYMRASLGQKGDYSRAVSYRAMGVVSDFGRVFEFRMSDPVRFRLDYATLNERTGG